MCAVYGPKRFYAEVIVTVFKTSRVAKRDDCHSKLLFIIKNIGQWNAKSGLNVADGNVAMRTTFSGRLESRNWSNFAHTHTRARARAAKLVVEIRIFQEMNSCLSSAYSSCTEWKKRTKYYAIILRPLRSFKLNSCPRSVCFAFSFASR